MPILPSARLLLLLAAACCASTALADERADRVAASVKRLQGSDDTPCVPDRAAFGADLKRRYVQTSMLYGGISPQSAYWPEVEELRYQERIAICPDEAALRKTMSLALSSTMSPAELDAALAFFGSEAGKKLLAAAARPRGPNDVTAEVERYQQSSREMYRKIDELKERYRKDPR
jgi:Uncharacterized protein conserved in bacteria (DUF2059)